MSECRRCGAKIDFIRTKKGKWMPVDYGAVLVATGAEAGDEKFFDEEGNVIIGKRVLLREQADTAGFVPHWATCPYADEFRRRKT